MRAQNLPPLDTPVVLAYKMAGSSSSWYLYMPVCPQMPTCCACLYNRRELTVPVHKAD